MQTLVDTAPGLTLAILVLGADFNVSAEERRTLSQLVWHLIRKNNEFVVNFSKSSEFRFNYFSGTRTKHAKDNMAKGFVLNGSKSFISGFNF